MLWPEQTSMHVLGRIHERMYNFQPGSTLLLLLLGGLLTAEMSL